MVDVRVNLDAWRDYASDWDGNVVFLLNCLEEAYETMDAAIDSLERMIDKNPEKVKRNGKLQRIADSLKEWENV